MFDEFSRQCFQVGLVFAVVIGMIVSGTCNSPDTGFRVFAGFLCGFGLSSMVCIPVLAVHYVMMTVRERRGE